MSERSSEAHKPPKKDPGDISLGITDPHFALSTGLEGIVDACIKHGDQTVRYLEISDEAPMDVVERMDALSNAGILISASEEEKKRHKELMGSFEEEASPISIVIPFGSKQLYGERLFKNHDTDELTHVSDDEVFEKCGRLWRTAYEVVGGIPEGGFLRRTAMTAHDFDESGLKIIPELSEWIKVDGHKELVEHLKEQLKAEMLETINSSDKVSHFVEIFINGFEAGKHE